MLPEVPVAIARNRQRNREPFAHTVTSSLLESSTLRIPSRPDRPRRPVRLPLSRFASITFPSIFRRCPWLRLRRGHWTAFLSSFFSASPDVTDVLQWNMARCKTGNASKGEAAISGVVAASCPWRLLKCKPLARSFGHILFLFFVTPSCSSVRSWSECFNWKKKSAWRDLEKCAGQVHYGAGSSICAATCFCYINSNAFSWFLIQIGHFFEHTSF